MFQLFRPALFALDPETAHHATLDALKTAHCLGTLPLVVKRPADDPRTVMGLTFPNPVGLAAGLDKNGGLHRRARRARFRLHRDRHGHAASRSPAIPSRACSACRQAQGIINRMGFNNDGVDALVENVKRAKFKGILGINIGKNADTPIEKAADDYLIGLRKVYAHASYVAINISSPNTKNLRQLQGGDELDALLAQLKAEQEKLAQQHGKYVPLAVKIAPDLDADQIKKIAALLIKHRIDGVIATNTTLSREGVEGSAARQRDRRLERRAGARQIHRRHPPTRRRIEWRTAHHRRRRHPERRTCTWRRCRPGHRWCRCTAA